MNERNIDSYCMAVGLSLIVVIMFFVGMRVVQSFSRQRSVFKSARSLTKVSEPSVSPPPLLSFEERMSVARSREWNIGGLKTEVSRLYLRAMKKSAKCHERLGKTTTTGQPTDDITAELQEATARAQQLKTLEDSLSLIKSTKDESFAHLLNAIVTLDVTDTPPIRMEIVKKPKQPKATPRKPYFVYKSKDDIDIFVGRAAEDNDKLSCDKSLRDEDDWWLHVAGYPGSHVVIRCTDNDLPTRYPETLRDAVALAAQNSKFEPKSRAVVTVTRVRYVKKPAGAKAGLVTITARESNIKLIKIDLNSETARMERLKKEE